MKKAIITGGASGIGYGIYNVFSKAGICCAIISRNCGSKRHKFSEDTILVNADISVAKETDEAIRSIMHEFGDLDILVNNAGINFPGRLITSTHSDNERIILVNLLGTINVTRAVLPFFLEKGCGTIVNITSRGAWTGVPGLSVYCASKFGVKGFSEALRKEVAEQGIRIIEVAPGGVRSDIHKGRKNVDLSVAIAPEDIAATVLFAATQPDNVSINEIRIRHTSQKVTQYYVKD